MAETTSRYVPDYITPGAKVAVYWTDRSRRRYAVVTVQRVNKMSVTVTGRDATDSRRYTLAEFATQSLGGAPSRRTGTWSPTEYLLPLDHPDVVTARQEARERKAVEDVVAAVERLRRDPKDPDAIAAVKAATRALTPGAADAAERVAAFLTARAPMTSHLDPEAIASVASDPHADNPMRDLRTSDLRTLLAALGQEG